MSKFQIILLSVFGVAIVAAVLVFSLYRGGSSTSANLSVWGTLPAEEFIAFLSDARLNQNKNISFTYTEKPAATIDRDFTEALATGKGPDLIILPETLVRKETKKLMRIPFASVSEADYKNTFIEEGNIFLDQSGAYALPIAIDPMVLYWNRDVFASAALAKPIGYWDEMYAASEKLTQRDAAGNITKSAIALGETKNIPHAKDILAMLILQAGNPITTNDSFGYRSVLSQSFNTPVVPAHAAVEFYTQFSNPQKPFYSWNRSLLPALSSFSVGDSAMYLGFASEYKNIRAKSPTLNVGVARVPQSRTSPNVMTLGRLYGVSVTIGTKNPAAALQGALLLVSNQMAAKLSSLTGMPPARRDLLATRPSDEAGAAFYTAALQSRGWIDPDGAETAKIFTTLIDAVTSGRSATTEAVGNADQALQAVIDNQR